jgi:dTDP-glucose pyrophosphorylase/CBS domain-containing protein
MDKEKLKSLLISTEVTIKSAMQKLDATAEKILFVVDERKRLLGTISDGDIRRGIINGLGFSESVKKIMHKEPATIKSNIPEIEKYARELMIEKEIMQIPVLDAAGTVIDVILWIELIGEMKHIKPHQQHPNQIVVMAGGKGARLDPFTKILPKPLIPIGNKTIIEHIMERFHNYGFHEFIYTLNYKKDYIKLFLKENDFPYNIQWVEEEDFLGTAGSLSLLKDKISETFFVTNCDSLLDDVDFENILEWHREHKASVTIVGCRHEFKIPFGVLKMSNGTLEGISEKPVYDVIINVGVYVMEPHVTSCIPEGQYLDMNDFIEMIMDKEKISVYPIIYGSWIDIGQWEEYKKSLKKFGDTENV